MAYEVEAFGKIIEVPDDVPKHEAYKQIMANRHKLDPSYVPEKPGIGDKLNDLAAEYLAVDKSTIAKAFTSSPSIADQAEASAAEGENTAARQVPGAPVRQSAYNQALLDPRFGIRPTERFRKPNVNGVLDRTRVVANEDIKGQADQQELELLRTEAMKPSESGFTQSALNSAGRTIKGAGQIGSDFFDADKNNAITQYGQKLLDNNPLWVNKLEDIRDEPFLAFKEASGNSVPSMGAMVGVSAVGAGIASLAPLTGPAAPIVAAVGTVVQWLGPAAVAALPSYSGIRDSQILKDPKNETDGKSKAIAAIGASAVGAIEVAFGPQQWAIAMLTKEGRAAMARKFASTSIGEAAIKGGLKGGAVELSEELVQSPIEQLASYEDPTTKKSLLETAHGGAMGFLGGTFPGAVTGAASQAAQKTNIDKLKPIADAPTVDDAIVAAHTATAGKEDVLRTVDPTLADIEAITGVKPNETQATIDAGQAQAAKILDIVLPDNSSVKAEWKIVDADQLAASMKEDVNQPRDRTRAASDVQIKSIANAPDYRRLSDSPVMDVGAPVVDQAGRIVAGNGRFAGLSQAYEQGTATEYINQLREDAARKGLSIEGIAKPVLVRQLSEPVDTRKMAIASNSGTTLQMSALEQANLDAERMKGIENLEVNDLGDIALTPKNLTQLKDSLGSYVGTELGAMVDKGGQLSQEGMRRVRNAMLAKAYGSSPTLEKLVESTDTDMRNVLGALTKSANHIIKTKGDVKSLMEAVDTYSQLKATGQPVDNFLAQQDAFSDGLSKEAEGILRFIDTNVRSQKKLTDFFKGNFVEVDTTSADMFSTPQPALQSVKAESRSETTIKVGKVGDKMSAGEVVLTASGRKATPFPKLDFDSKGKSTNTTKRVDSWLIDNAIKEAESRGDAFNILQFRNVNLKNLSQSDKDAAEEYLFGQQPDVPRPFTKPMGSTKDERIASLEKHLKDAGYDFTVEPASVRDIDALDSTKKARKELAEKQAKLFKKKVVFVKADGPFRINGVMVPSIADTIFVDIRTDKAFDAIMAHELSHWMEQEKPAVYKELVKSLKTVIINEAEYAKKYGIEGATKSEITKEIVGDLMGDNFTEQSFWQKVAEANPEAFKDIAAAIIKWLKGVIVKAKANGMGSEQWVKDATKAQDIIAKAVAQYTESDATSASAESKPKFNVTGDNKSDIDKARAILNRLSDLYTRMMESKDKALFSEFGERAVEAKDILASMLESGKLNGIGIEGKSLLSRNTSSKNPWRITFFSSVDGEPAGHNEFKTAKEALNDSDLIVRSKDKDKIALFSRAYHGSPHDHNKFESSKIGTGEGAQAYGYGHYFAESKDVAEHYKETLENIKPATYSVNGKRVDVPSNDWRLMYLQSAVDNRLSDQIRSLEKGNAIHNDAGLAKEIEYAKSLEGKEVTVAESDKVKGKLYEVELAPEQDEYLLWDKPLSEQSDKVKSALDEIGIPDSAMTGQEIYSYMKEVAADESGKTGTTPSFYNGFSKEASDKLRAIGIRGIKYLDGSSRAKGEGAYNYVIFDDKDVSITAKFSKAAVDNTLIAQHNLSVRNLIHADRMGGLAAPSIAVTDKAHPLTGFGEITLLSHKDLIDPKNGTKIFGSDIYSPRYPSISYDFSGKPIKALNALLAEGVAATGDSEYYNDNLHDDPFRELTHSSAAMYTFLSEQGVEPELAYVKPRDLPDQRLMKFVDERKDSFDLSNDDEFKATAKAIFADKSDRADTIDEKGLGYITRDYANQVVAHREAVRNAGKVDRQATNSKLFRQISDSNLRNKFDEYLVDLVNKAEPKEKIFKGYTNAGNRQYMPHDIDTVIKILKKDLRGGENFKYGLGSIRAKYSPQFKSIEQIRKSKGMLMNSESFDQVKKEVQAGLDGLNESLASYGTFSGYDNVETMLSDAAKRGISGALKDNGFENVPDSIKVDIQTFLNKLKDMPTEYFEAKILRAVGLGEFSTAIIPDDSTPQVEAILKKNGIEDIRKYKSGDNEDRVKQINKVTHVMFSRAPKLYSKLEQALEAASDKIYSTGPQVKLWLQSNAGKLGIKKDEIYWSGIDNWLDAQGKVSKQQVVEFVRNNGAKVEDVTLGVSKEFTEPYPLTENEDSELMGLYAQSFDDLSKSDQSRYDELDGKLKEWQDLRTTVEQDNESSKAKHNNDKLTLPGGTDYKELVVTVPTIEPHNADDSTHFGDTGQGKQIGWLRMDTRDGGLFIEELQSQRAQQGRSKGFNQPLSAEDETLLADLIARRKELFVELGNHVDDKDETTFDRVNNERKEVIKQIAELERKGSGDLVPPAPFVSDSNQKATNAYITLLMKKALIEAVSNDHASVSWTTGDQQADRYDLSKQIDSTTWTEWPAAGKDHGILVAYKDGDQVIKETIPRSKLPDYIGKPVAEKLLAQPDDIGGRKSLEGIDLKVGGEWAQSMYGNEQGLNLQGKPSLISQAANDIFKHVGSGKVESINGQPGFYVTPEMKNKDLPLFSFAGPKAETADKYALETAQQRIAAGDPDDTVRQETGWFKGVDGKWRFEINDSDAKLTRAFMGTKHDVTGDIYKRAVRHLKTDRMTVGDIINHPKLFEAYPNVANIEVYITPGLNAGYNKVNNLINLGYLIPRKDLASILLHEIQHGIQHIEGFASGGNPNVFHGEPVSEWEIKVKALEDRLAKAETQEDRDNINYMLGHAKRNLAVAGGGDKFERYKRLAGEVEARNTQGRLGMNETERKATAPNATQDIPDSDQIIVYNGTEMAYEPEKPTPPDESRLRRFQRMNQDSFNRFTVIKEWLAENGQTLSDKADVHGAEERYHSMAANQLEDFREQQRNPLIEKIQKAGYTLGDIEVFLKMQHTPEANAANQKLTGNPESTAAGITDEEANEYLAEAPENLAKLANELRDITEQTKKLRLDAGILNTDITGAWENTYKFYVPMKGEADSTRGVGKGLKTNFKSKRRLGHSLRDEHVIENILMDHERAILEVERNRVGKHLVMMAAEMQRPDILSIDQPEKRKMLKESTAYTVEANGVVQGVFKSREEAKMFKQFYAASMPKVAPSAIVINQTKDQRVIASASPMLAENEVNVYMNGHAIRVQINDELLARAYTKMGVEQFSDIVGAGRILNGYLSKVYTGYNPEFILTNMIRDFSSGTINLTGEQGFGMATKALTNYPRMFTDLLKYAATNGKSSTKWIDAYRKNGGNTGAAYLSDMERLGNEVNTEYASYQGVLSNLKQGDTANAARAAGRKVFNATLKWIYNLNQAGENAMRLAAFKAMIDSGRTVNEAAKVAKNITVNFNRKGERQWAPALYLFYNASVQGTAATAHALTKGKHKGQAWALAGSMAAVGYMMAASFGGGDEDDWDEINDYTKERNMLIKSGDGYVKVPVPYGYGFFWNFGRHMAEAQRTGELGTIPWHLATSAISEFTPFNDVVVGSDEEFRSDQVFMGLLPTAMKIVAQPTFNKQLFTGSELMPESQFDKSQPDRQKMFRSTKGTMYDTVAGWLDSAGIDVSPETLKYITRTGTGGAGSLVDTGISAAMLKSEGAELDIQEIPFVRKGYMELGIKDKRAAYYKVREEARTAAEEFNRARRDNDVAKMQDVLKDKKELIALDRYANKLAATIDAARDQQDAVRADKNLSVQEKRLKLKDMEATEAKFYDQYLDVFKTSKR